MILHEVRMLLFFVTWQNVAIELQPFSTQQNDNSQMHNKQLA